MARPKKAATTPNLGQLQAAIIDAALHLAECKEERDAAVEAHQEAFRQLADLRGQFDSASQALIAATTVQEV